MIELTKPRRLVWALLFALVLTGCSPTTDPGPPSTTTTTTQGVNDSPEFEREDLMSGWEVLGQSEYYWIDDVIAIEGGYLAVGATGVHAGVWSSADGTAWESMHSNQNALGSGRMVAVTAAPFGLVAVGQDDQGLAVSWLSDDGNNWERIEGAFEEAEISDVAAGGPGVVAVGHDLRNDTFGVWTSSDGRMWTRVPHDPELFGLDFVSDPTVVSAIQVPHGLVMVGCCDNIDIGTSGEFTGLSSVVWWSPDGLTWQRVGADLFDNVLQLVVAAGPNGFMILGDNDDEQSVPVLVSSDGATWKDGGMLASGWTDSNHQVSISALIWTGTDWLAGGSRCCAEWTAFRSADGSTWEEAQMPQMLGLHGISAVASGPEGAVAVADGGYLAYSSDGMSWAVVAGDLKGPVPDASGFVSVVATDTALFAVGADIFNGVFEGIWTSTDGRKWHQVETDSSLTAEFLDLQVWWNDHLVAVGDDGIWLSPDGVTWAKTSDPTNALNGHLPRVVAAGSVLVAFGESGIWLSADGETWRPVPDDPSFFSVPVTAVAADSRGRLLAIGEFGSVVWASNDGETWTKLDQPAPLLPDWYQAPALTATESGWVLVGAVGTDNPDLESVPAAWVSSDGATWERSEVRSSRGGWMSAIAGFPGGMVGIGVPGIWVSEDARIWDEVAPVESAFGFDVVVWKDQIVGVGAGDYPIIWLRPTPGS